MDDMDMDGGQDLEKHLKLSSESTSVTFSASVKEVRMFQMAVPVMLTSTFLTPKVLVPNWGGDSRVHRLRMCSIRKEVIFRIESGIRYRVLLTMHEWCLPKVS